VTNLDVDQAKHIAQMIFEMECKIAALEDDLEALCFENPQLLELDPTLLQLLRQGWDRKHTTVCEAEVKAGIQLPDVFIGLDDLFRGEF